MARLPSAHRMPERIPVAEQAAGLVGTNTRGTVTETTTVIAHMPIPKMAGRAEKGERMLRTRRRQVRGQIHMPHLQVRVRRIADPEMRIRHLADAETMGLMHRSTCFISISCGDFVDEAALIAPLQAGQIAGSGLDVCEYGPLVRAALKMREAIGMMLLENLIAHSAGQPSMNPV